ncbi:MAG: hypothetical protein M1381_05820 [Deltaproteobacteria bacterium]|nr:hypothetical protein [Deltaproteobacteria bacterium]MCL5791767.1 hypothetical protein [Deltaproteobacteria bacterium]
MPDIHIIISKDSSYNTDLIRKLKKEYTKDNDSVEVFDGNEANTGQIDNALFTSSLFSQKKVVIINDFESLRSNTVDVLNRFSNSNITNLCLIMSSEESDVLKEKQFQELLSSKHIKRHVQINLTTYGLIQNHIKQHQIKITKEAIDMLVSILEISTWGIVENELTKLATYAGKDGFIDENTVSELTFNIDKADTFKFVDDIIKMDEKSALRDLKKIKDTGSEPIMVIGAIAWKFRQLLQNSYEERFVKGLNLIYKYSLALREGKISNNLILDRLVIELLH